MSKPHSVPAVVKCVLDYRGTGQEYRCLTCEPLTAAEITKKEDDQKWVETCERYLSLFCVCSSIVVVAFLLVSVIYYSYWFITPTRFIYKGETTDKCVDTCAPIEGWWRDEQRGNCSVGQVKCWVIDGVKAGFATADQDGDTLYLWMNYVPPPKLTDAAREMILRYERASDEERAEVEREIPFINKVIQEYKAAMDGPTCPMGFTPGTGEHMQEAGDIWAKAVREDQLADIASHYANSDHKAGAEETKQN